MIKEWMRNDFMILLNVFVIALYSTMTRWNKSMQGHQKPPLFKTSWAVVISHLVIIFYRGYRFRYGTYWHTDILTSSSLYCNESEFVLFFHLMVYNLNDTFFHLYDYVYAYFESSYILLFLLTWFSCLLAQKRSHELYKLKWEN